MNVVLDSEGESVVWVGVGESYDPMCFGDVYDVFGFGFLECYNVEVMFVGIFEEEITLVFFIEFPLDIPATNFEDLISGMAGKSRANACEGTKVIWRGDYIWHW
jgi:hypothetical protein